MVGVALLAVAGLAAAAAFAMAALPSKLIVRLANTVTSETYAKGSAAVDMIEIALTASGGPAFISSLNFYVLADDDASFATVENDLTASDFFQSCSLYNSSSVLISGPKPVTTGGLLTFDALTIGVGKGKTENYKVSCDLANITTASSNNDIFALTINNESDVVANRLNGSSFAGRTLDIGNSSDVGINLNGSSVAITVSDSGTLSASLDSTSPSSEIILGSSTDIPVAVWRFTALNEAFEINTMTLNNAEDDEVANTVKISCVNSSGATSTYTGYLSNGFVVFNGLNCYVPKDDFSRISVLIDTNQVSNVGAASGSLIRLSFVDTDFEAVGLSSGRTVAEGDLSTPVIVANTMTLYKTKPTISLNSGSPSGSAFTGSNEVFRFNVAADARGYVTLNEIAFAMLSTDIAATYWNRCDLVGGNVGLDEPDLSLYNMNDLSTALDLDGDWSMYDSGDGSVCTEDVDVVDYVLLNFTTPVEIAAGETSTFALYMTFDTNGANGAEDDMVRISLQDNATTDSGIIGTRGTINWEDDSETTDLFASFITSLPTYGNTLTF